VSPKGFNNLLLTLSFSFPALAKASLSFRPTQLQVTLTGGVEAAAYFCRLPVVETSLGGESRPPEVLLDGVVLSNSESLKPGVASSLSGLGDVLVVRLFALVFHFGSIVFVVGRPGQPAGDVRGDPHHAGIHHSSALRLAVSAWLLPHVEWSGGAGLASSLALGFRRSGSETFCLEPVLISANNSNIIIVITPISALIIKLTNS